MHIEEIEQASEPMNHEESVKRLIVILERSINRKGWGDDQTSNALLGTMHVVDMGDNQYAYGIKGHESENLLPEMRADFAGTLPKLAAEFLQREQELLTEKRTEAFYDESGFLGTVDGSFYGWVVSFEAFGISSEDNNAELYSRLKQVNLHPNRVEQRLVVAMGLDNLLVTAVRTKGQSDDEVKVVVVDGEKMRAEGTIHQALSMLNVASGLALLRRFRDGDPPAIFKILTENQLRRQSGDE